MDRKPKVAVYHNLASGGAHRAAMELLRRTRDRFDYTLIVPRLAGTNLTSPGPDLDTVFISVPQIPGRLGDFLSLIVAERRAAATLASRDLDLALVHPCRLTQTPYLRLPPELPSVLFVQEPRRKSFEKGYNRFRQAGVHSFVRRTGASAIEPALRARDKRAVANGAALLCNSIFSSESIQRAYGRTAIVSHLGVDPDAFRIGSTQADRPYVLSVGGLEPAKGHDLLIEGLRSIPASERPTAVIVGGRSIRGYDDFLRAKAHEGGVELELRFNEPEEGLIALYQGACATFCGSRLEPFGLTALESVSCGTPVVAVREGGFRESVTDGVNAHFVDREAESVAQAILSIRAGKLPDREAIRSSILPYWTWDSAADRFSAHINRILRAPELK